MESIPSDPTPLKKAVPVRPASIRYLGFECTSEGRAYRLRVDGVGEPRLFTVTIPTVAFESRKARFQDAPGLCFTKLQRALAADPDLLPGARLVLTTEELLDFRDAREARAPERKRRAPAPGGFTS